MTKLDALFMEMTEFDRGNSHRVQHFTKVHAYCSMIGRNEKLSERELEILEAAAYVHDIGIRPAIEKYGNGSGPYQEELGPAYAEEMLGRLGFDEELIARVSYLVGHHHTYTNIDGIDYRILVEADFLVNLHEKDSPKETVLEAYRNIFVTETGKAIARNMFGL